MESKSVIPEQKACTQEGGEWGNHTGCRQPDGLNQRTLDLMEYFMLIGGTDGKPEMVKGCSWGMKKYHREGMLTTRVSLYHPWCVCAPWTAARWTQTFQAPYSCITSKRVGNMAWGWGKEGKSNKGIRPKHPSILIRKKDISFPQAPRQTPLMFNGHNWIKRPPSSSQAGKQGYF